MPNRQTTDNQYRYAFQGQEKDPETGMEAFELRLWDGRIGRWLTFDPYGQYPSPYLGMGNNPISRIDPDGGFAENDCPNCPNGMFTNDAEFLASDGYTYAFDQGLGWGDIAQVNVSSNSSNIRNSIEDMSMSGLVFTINMAGTHANNNISLGFLQLPNEENFGDYELSARLGKLAGNIASIIQGGSEDLLAGGLEYVTLAGATAPAAVLALHGSTVALAGSVGTGSEISGLVDYFAHGKKKQSTGKVTDKHGKQYRHGGKNRPVNPNQRAGAEERKNNGRVDD